MTGITRADRIEALLREAFDPSSLVVEDDSARHAGHSGAAPGGETHFTVRMVAGSFSSLNRIARSRAVHDVLQPEFGSGLHALSLELRSPTENLSKNR